VLTLLRHNRGFTVFLLTQGISNLGDAVRNVVVPLVVLLMTRSPLVASALALLETLPILVFQLPAGALLDRWDRRLTLLLADVGRGLITLLIPLTALLHGPLLAVLFATALPLSVLSCLFSAGFGAVTPALAGRERLDQAYSLVEGIESLAWVVGPAVAAGLVATVGGATALTVDGLSFLMSAAGLAAIRVPRTERPSPGRGSLAHDLLDGLRFLAANRALRDVQVSWTFYGAIGYGIVLGLVYVGTRGGSEVATLASLAVAAYAGGSLFGTLGAGWRRTPYPSAAVAACLAILGVGALMVAISQPALILVGALLFGFGEGYFLVVFLAVRARMTPDEMMGRINSAGILLSYLATGIAVVWTGAALQWLHGTGTFLLLAVLALVLAAWVALTQPMSAPAPHPSSSV